MAALLVYDARHIRCRVWFVIKISSAPLPSLSSSASTSVRLLLPSSALSFHGSDGSFKLVLTISRHSMEAQHHFHP
eukprot:764189-Hanusia_phi.AAC.2